MVKTSDVPIFRKNLVIIVNILNFICIYSLTKFFVFFFFFFFLFYKSTTQLAFFINL